jgi:hypothetical protein
MSNLEREYLENLRIHVDEGGRLSHENGLDLLREVEALLTVKSESDSRTANNAVRHQYRVLSEDEKAKMVAIKDKGAELLALIEDLGAGRELSIARTKTEEAIMWAVKHITA